LNYITDEFRQSATPIGIVLWSADPNCTRVRVASEKEKIKGLKSNAYTFVRLAKGKIENWASKGTLPYASDDIKPATDEWWRHVSKLLVHGVRLSEPRAIDCRDVDKETELLFEALVKPHRAGKERRERIDWELTRTLGKVADKLERGAVQGFKGRAVPVKRFACDDKKLMIVEGVNLTSAAAEQDTDALVSRLLRIRDANGAGTHRDVTAYVGYLASPAGLNGEAALVEWIEKKADAKVFDLVRQAEVFTTEIKGSLSKLKPKHNQQSTFSA
jgi:hypothetical protein